MIKRPVRLSQLDLLITYGNEPRKMKIDLMDFYFYFYLIYAFANRLSISDDQQCSIVLKYRLSRCLIEVRKKKHPNLFFNHAS